MPPVFNSQITRADAQALMPEEVSREISAALPQQSSVLQLARRLPDMSRAQVRMPILSALPIAYFVDGDTGLKQTSEAAWANKYIDAAELAVICPIPENVLDDVDYPIWDEVKPYIVEAMGKAIDQAVFYGINAPSVWPTNIVAAALAAGNHSALNAFPDIFDALLSEGGSISKLEEDGYMATGHVASMNMRAKLRGLRDANGQPIFLQSMQQTGRYELDGEQILFPRNGAIDSTRALLISGAWNQLVWSMRQDIQWKLLTESVIQDSSGAIIYNLAQQDMVALRATMRLGWNVPNPINQLQVVEASRYPFSTLTSA